MPRYSSSRTTGSYNRPYNSYGRTGTSMVWLYAIILFVIVFFGNSIVDGIMHLLGY